MAAEPIAPRHYPCEFRGILRCMHADHRNWDAILFDLDGTLIDSVPLILDSFAHTFESCGLPRPSVAELLRGIGTPLSVHFACYTREATVVEQLVATYRAYNLAHHDARVTAFAGIQAMVEEIRSAGLPMGVVTSKNRLTTERGLRVTGLAEYIQTIVPSDEVDRPKPHPEPLERAMTLLGARAERTVFVGDSLHDLHAGRAARVRTVAALWGPFGREELLPAAPDYWADTPEVIGEILGLRRPDASAIIRADRVASSNRD